MDFKEAIVIAKNYILDVYADERVTNLEVEEIEHASQGSNWIVTLGLSRPWGTPRTRAQEVLENLGNGPSLRRSFKTITIAEDGTVLAMKNRVNAENAA